MQNQAAPSDGSLGLDTTSFPSNTRQSTYPFILNLVNKEGNGLKRRDGLLEGVDISLLPTEIIVGSQASDDESIYYIVKNNNDQFRVIRVAGNGSITTSAVTGSIYSGTQSLRFKIIDKFPSTTTNLFIYGRSDDGSYFNLSSSLSSGVLNPFVNNTILTSSQASGMLNILDHGYADNRIFTLIFDASNDRYVLVYGSQQNTALNSFYILPNNIRGRGAIVYGDTVFIFAANSVYKIKFESGFAASPIFSKFMENYGLFDAWSYSVVGTDAYCACISSIYKFSVQPDKLLLLVKKIEDPIDESISNLIPNLKIYKTTYKWDEKSIYFICSIDNRFISRAIYGWISNSGVTSIPNWETFYADIRKENRFVIVYNIQRKAWFLLYFDKPLVGIDAYRYDLLFDLTSEFIFTNKDETLHSNKDIDQDNLQDFPVGVLPSVKNELLLTDVKQTLERISISILNSSKQSGSCISRPVDCSQNITRRYSEYMLSDSNMNKYEISEKPTQTIIQREGLSGLNTSILTMFSSSNIDVYHGAVVNALSLNKAKTN